MSFLSRLLGKRQTPEVPVMVQQDERPIGPPGTGWRQWMHDRPDNNPYEYDQIEVWHETWKHGPVVKNAWTMHPAQNVFGLWWRPVS